MRVTLVTHGSHGDIRPLVALGAGLVRAGHAVVFPADREFKPLIERHGIEHRPLSGDVRAATREHPAADALFRRGTNPVQMTKALARMAQDHAEAWLREYHGAARGSDVVVASGLGFYAGAGLAEALGVPMVGAALQPMGPTRAFPPPILPVSQRLPGVVNFALHVLLMQLVWLGFRPGTNRARRAVLGLPPIPLSGLGARLLRERWPLLYAHSPSVLPRPDDWPDFLHVTGYWFLDEADGYQPLDALRRFLDAGPPPVYVGFGSMGGYDPAQTTALVLEALGGRRAVLSAGWGGLDPSALPPNVHGLEMAPHDWLLPRMGALVHHGGAGTTAAGLRAGVPSFVVPFLGDQPFWGRRVEALGVGPAPVPRRALTVQRLAAALDAMENPAMRQRAAALGAAVRAEDGVAAAVRIIEAAVC